LNLAYASIDKDKIEPHKIKISPEKHIRVISADGRVRSKSDLVFIPQISTENPQSHIKVLTAESQIHSVAVNPKDGVIAYAEKQNIKLVKWSASSGIATILTELKITDDLTTVCLCFSTDGRFLASLGGIPTHQIIVWDWKSQKKIVLCPNMGPAKHISFNPADNKSLCTSGCGEAIRFWQLKPGFKKCKILQVIVNNTVFSETSNFKPSNHIWGGDKLVLSSSVSGDEVYCYNIETATASVLFSTVMDNPTYVSEFSEMMGVNNMRVVLKNKYTYIFGGKVLHNLILGWSSQNC
jgi:WD40 repeat protein